MEGGGGAIVGDASPAGGRVGSTGPTHGFARAMPMNATTSTLTIAARRLSLAPSVLGDPWNEPTSFTPKHHARAMSNPVIRAPYPKEANTEGTTHRRVPAAMRDTPGAHVHGTGLLAKRGT